MNALLYTLHVVVSLFLIAGILFQPGAKGGGMGSVFGGGGANSAFGARGAAPILAKLTYWLAAGFMVTCLSIEVFIIQQNKSVFDKVGSTSTPITGDSTQTTENQQPISSEETITPE
ncbi:MAG: preprotein translocase subunit SecG [Holophagaceae bacterium]|nr:preprotein translocase subunit SecG [Holophagaceae bacterium]